MRAGVEEAAPLHGVLISTGERREQKGDGESWGEVEEEDWI
jgi:hypothetical protein